MMTINADIREKRFLEIIKDHPDEQLIKIEYTERGKRSKWTDILVCNKYTQPDTYTLYSTCEGSDIVEFMFVREGKVINSALLSYLAMQQLVACS